LIAYEASHAISGRHVLAVAFLLGVPCGGNVNAAEAASEIGKRLDALMDDGIKLLEANQEVEFMEKFIHPVDLKAFTTDTTIKALASRLKTTDLLASFKDNKGKVPMLALGANYASYLWNNPFGRRDSLQFQRHEGQWYIDDGRRSPNRANVVRCSIGVPDNLVGTKLLPERPPAADAPRGGAIKKGAGLEHALHPRSREEK
jgi:hypothetical protein